MLYNHSTQELEEVLLEEEIADVGNSKAQLVVFNDDFNTFDWVIQSFVEILQHQAEQAEQCAMLIHFKGKAIVKTASLKILKPLRQGLVDRGLSAIIEEEKE